MYEPLSYTYSHVLQMGWTLGQAHAEPAKEVPEPSRPVRVNGWTWPTNWYQVMAVVGYCYIVFMAAMFIPLLPSPWSYASGTVSLTRNPPPLLP